MENSFKYVPIKDVGKLTIFARCHLSLFQFALLRSYQST